MKHSARYVKVRHILRGFANMRKTIGLALGICQYHTQLMNRSHENCVGERCQAGMITGDINVQP
jgi:hypothetical protein